MQFNEVRNLFPGLKNKTFFDAACVSLIPQTAREEMIKFLDMAIECPFKDASLHHIAMDQWRSKTVKEAAQLFNVESSRVALIESTSQGLNIAVNALNLESESEVLIIDTEFLQVAIPFSKQQEQGRVKIVPVITPANFQVNLDTLLQYVTPKTKCICISSVQWCTGYRLPMQEIGQFCKENGIWLIVDGVQEAGALHVDLTKRYCDFYITGGHKWLNSPYGCGLMVISDRALSLNPPGYGYLALQEPEGGWGAYFQNPKQSPYAEYKFPKTAKVFETGGTSNYPGAIGLTESLKILNSFGTSAIEDRVLELGEFLQKNLKKLGVKIISPEPKQMRSGITIFQVFDDPQKNREVLNQLLDRKILLSMRYTSGIGGLRVSTHYYNNEEDILNLCDALNQISNNTLLQTGQVLNASTAVHGM